MSYSDLLDRMKSKEPEAFLEMTERYGWAVYSAIRKKYTDRVIADRVYDETMKAFYYGLSHSDADDPVEALLCAFADHISLEKLRADSPIGLKEISPPQIKLLSDELTGKETNPPLQRKNRFGYFLGLLLLLASAVMIFWFFAGFLMERNLIPYSDLGYSCFNAFVMHIKRIISQLM